MDFESTIANLEYFLLYFFFKHFTVPVLFFSSKLVRHPAELAAMLSDAITLLKLCIL